MSNSKRSLIIAIVAGAAVVTVVVGMLAWTVIRAGAVEVRVAEAGPGGADLHLYVPAILLKAGVCAVPDRVFAEVRAEMSAELEDYWPVLEAVCDGLRDCPDGVFVRVDSADERVEIVKKKGHLLVEVDDGGDHVRIRFPLNCMDSVVAKLAPRT
jgi:hypothetical protein